MGGTKMNSNAISVLVIRAISKDIVRRAHIKVREKSADGKVRSMEPYLKEFQTYPQATFLPSSIVLGFDQK